MPDKYEKKQAYEFCEIRNMMVQLDVIQATVQMPDLAHAEMKLIPVDCNRAEDCKRNGISCMVFDTSGNDPCPDAWRSE